MKEYLSNELTIYAIVSASLIALAHIFDLLLYKKEIHKFYSLLLRGSNLISRTPIKEWQLKIARAGDIFLNLLYLSTFILYAVFCIYRADKNIIPERLRRFGFHRILAFISFLSIYIVIYYFFVNKLWVLGCLCVPIIYHNIVTSLFPLNERFPKFMKYALKLIPVVFISSVLSMIALYISIYKIDPNFSSSTWFFLSQGKLYPNNSFVLTLLNFPFDFITICITLYLLNIVIRKNGYIILIAILNIITSLLISIFLYSMLLLLGQNGNFLQFHAYLIKSIIWYKDVFLAFLAYLGLISHNSFAYLPNIHLLPLLLTTLVPVLIYMSTFIALTLLKYLFKLISRFFGVLGENEKPVFKVYITSILIIIGAIKLLIKIMFY